MSATRHIHIFDTTLRDGEQSPGCSMTTANKLTVAKALQDLGVDIIEAGFAAASEGDFEAVSRIAQQARGITICSLARANTNDVDQCARALAKAQRSRAHIFLASSPIHREHKLQMSKEQVLENADRAIRYAKDKFFEIEFSPEDAGRTEPEFLREVVKMAIDAGATIINLPDTVGFLTPWEYGAMFEDLRRHVAGIEKIALSAHCHNDLGMAVANSLAAIRAGATQIECTINGIGERAGNCAMEELVMALKVRPSEFGGHTQINTQKFLATSRLVTRVTGSVVAANKAVVGENAFAHEAGIHQHGLLRNSATYEIMLPEDVGFSGTTLVLGKHSGRHAFRERLNILGHILDEATIEQAFLSFKRLADKCRVVTDADLENLIAGLSAGSVGPWSLQSVQTLSKPGDDTLQTVMLTLSHADGRSVKSTAAAENISEALLKAVGKAAGMEYKAADIQSRSFSSEDGKQGNATVALRHQGQNYRVQAHSPDPVQAVALALVDLSNRICRMKHSAEHEIAV